MAYITSSNFQIQSSFSSYADEAYISQNVFLQAGIFTTDGRIDTAGEGYTGLVRDYKTLNPTINVPNETIVDTITPDNVSTQKAIYVKAMRNYSFGEMDVSEVLSRQDGFAKVARDAGEIRATADEAQAMAIINGVMRGNIKDNSGDLVTFNVKTTTGAATATTFLGGKNLAALIVGKMNADPRDFIIVMGWDVYTNLVDGEYIDTTNSQTTVLAPDQLNSQRDLGFGTYRGIPVLVTRSIVGVTTAAASLDDTQASAVFDSSKKQYATYVIRRGSIALQDYAPQVPVETQRESLTGNGGGSETIVYRWGNVMLPTGYSWTTTPSAFPTNDNTAGNLAHEDSWNRIWNKFNTGVACIVTNG